MTAILRSGPEFLFKIRSIKHLRRKKRPFSNVIPKLYSRKMVVFTALAFKTVNACFTRSITHCKYWITDILILVSNE